MYTWARITLAAGIALLASCATSSKLTPEQRAAVIHQRAANRDKAMSQWTGRDISELIVQRGQPLKLETLPNGKQVYTWDGGLHAIDFRTGLDMGATCLERFVVDPATQRIVGHATPDC